MNDLRANSNSETVAATAGARPGSLELAVGALGLSSVMTQLALMRELLGAFAGNEMVFGISLGSWLLLTGLGSWLGRLAPRLRQPARLFVAGQWLIAGLPLGQLLLLRLLRDAVFTRGAVPGVAETVTGCLLLLLPYCLLMGTLLTLACHLTTDARANAGIGRIYVADGIGSVLGGLLFSFVLLRWFDHVGLLVAAGAVNLLAAGLLSWQLGFRSAVWGSAGLAVATALLLATIDLDALSTARQYAGQEVVFNRNSPYGRLVVTRTGSQYNFLENGLPLLVSHNVERAEETVHYALVQRPGARHVLLLSGGVSGTVQEVRKYPGVQITYVELDPLLLAAARTYLPETLAGDRVSVVTTDGRRFVKETAARFEVVIVDMPPPSTVQLNRFYTAEFFQEVKRVLSPDGVLSLSLGGYENYVSPELARLLASAHATLATAFRHVLLLPGGRVFLLASDSPLASDIAARLEAQHIPTQLLNRHYLDGMLTDDRNADLARALDPSAAVNHDFSPVLLYYHLRHWMNQFQVKFGILEVLLGLTLAGYLLTLKPAPLAVFASGFAASALELVLLLGFQQLYGSLYQQLGLIVTVFMAGLTAGAWFGGREPRNAPTSPVSNPLSRLALTVAALSGLLPFVLMGLGHLGSSQTCYVVGQTVIAGVTFLLAAVVGMEFPVAARLETAGPAATASRLYTADFIGACLGILLASTFLIPMLGVTTLCLLVALLNLLAAINLRRKTT